MMIKYDNIKKAIKGTLAAAGLAAAVYLTGCADNKPINYNTTPNFKQEYSNLDSRVATAENEIDNLGAESLEGLTITNNIYCSGNPNDTPCSQRNRNQVVPGGCGYKTNCELPDQYKNHVDLCSNPSIHCPPNNQSDSIHELLILYNGTLFNNPRSSSYVNSNTVKVKYKNGIGHHEGEIVNNIRFLVQNIDNCEYVEVTPGGSIPNGWRNMMVYEFGDINGALVQVASTPLGDWVSYWGNEPQPEPQPQPQPEPEPQPQPQPQPEPQPPSNPVTDENKIPDGDLEGKLEIGIYPMSIFSNCNLKNELRLHSGKGNNYNPLILAIPKNKLDAIEYKVDNSMTLIEIPVKLFLGLCDDGTDEKGRVTIECDSTRFLKGFENVAADYEGAIAQEKINSCSAKNAEFKNYSFSRFILNIPEQVGNNRYFTASPIGFQLSDGSKKYVKGAEPRRSFWRK